MGAKRVALVTGASGFIGYNLCRYLLDQGYHVRGVDIREPEFGPVPTDDFHLLDLRRPESSLATTRGVQEVYALAATMGGIGFIQSNRAVIDRDNVLIDMHTLEAARRNGVERLFYASSACVYPAARQATPDAAPLRESDAYPADPEDGYGWEKLFMERACRHFREDLGLDTRVARFHNTYGPFGAFEGGREKSPAAICRKVALAADGEAIEVWGDGRQTRSYCYVDDCVEGIHRLMRSECAEPLNLGSEELTTIDHMVDLVAGIAGKRIEKRHDLGRPVGVRGRNSDNTRLREALGWAPATPLDVGLAATYRWIASELEARGRLVARAAPGGNGG